jgi:hypothetical protein
MLIWIPVTPASRLLKFAAAAHSSVAVPPLADAFVSAPNVTSLAWNRGVVSAVHTITVIRYSSVEKHSVVAFV